MEMPGGDKMIIRMTYSLTIDGYIEHPAGELSVNKEDWERLKQYHIAIAREFISVSSSGGSEINAQQILASRGARFTKCSDDPPKSAFVPNDD